MKQDQDFDADQFVSTLNKADKQALLDRLALENQLTAAVVQNKDLDMWSEAILKALEETIGQWVGHSYGLTLVKRSMGTSSSWRPVELFMKNSKLQELTSAERQSAYFMLARLLVERADDQTEFVGAPLTLKYIAGQTGNLAAIFDRSFPGYLAAGLAKIVARQLTRERA